MITKLLTILFWAVFGWTACQSKMHVAVSSGSKSSAATNTTAIGHSSSTKALTLNTKNGSVTVPAAAYSKTSDIKLDEISSSKFLNAAGLTSPPAIVVAGPMTVQSVLTGTSTQTDPTSALSLKLFVSSSQTLGTDTAAVIEVTDADGKVTLFYVDHSSLAVQTDSQTGESYVNIGNIKSGNFAVALVSGLSSATLASKFKALPSDGTVISTSVPSHAATSVGFTDTDGGGGTIGGTVTIAAASDENDVKSYVLYWGTSSTSKQSTTPIATLTAIGSSVSYTFASGTIIPTSPAATCLLVYTSNSNGEMATGVSVLITDLGVPVNAAVSMSFTDSDATGGEIGGTINITKASSESDVSSYVLYWGSSSTTKQSSTPIATIAKTGSNLTYSVTTGTQIPSSATHLLVYTKNSGGEMATGISLLIIDSGVPTNAAVSMSFTDTDLTGGKIGGTVNITKASSEADVTHYVLYWGSSSTTKQNATAITTIAATGGNLTYSIAANTSIPSSPTATHLLVFTKNGGGEMATGVSVAITDLAAPVNAAVSMSFTDTDTDGGQIAGTVNITKSTNESDVTHYVLYWGSNSTTKQNGTAITTIAKTGSNLTYSIAANTSVPTGPAATHLLVFTKNADGEMATGISVAIVDVGVPTHASAGVSFTDTDTDGGQLGGTVTITKAANETDVTHYVLYWGSNSTTKQNVTAITSIAVTGSNVTYNIAANTAIPSSPTATHLLVFTKNADGEMATGVSVAITDVGVPVHASAGVAFTDTDTDGGQLAGTVTITKAANETDVTHYVLYWGSDSTTKQNATAITSIAVTGSNVTYNIAANTSIPSSPTATHLLVFTKNADGEMATGVSVAIVDVGVPVHAAASVAFTDTDTNSGKIGGTVTITKAANEADVTHYVLYWGSDSTTKQNGTAIATLAVTGSNVTQSVSANTSIPTGPTATHFLVYTKNADGEMGTGVSVAISDNTGASCTAMGASVGGYCWYKGSSGMSCDSTCTIVGLAYDAATVSYAGTSGSQAQCNAVADAVLGGTSGTYTHDTAMPFDIGCASNTGTTGGTVYWFTNTTTTSTGNNGAMYRFCACH